MELKELVGEAPAYRLATSAFSAAFSETWVVSSGRPGRVRRTVATSARWSGAQVYVAWGIAATGPYLHDGRADTLAQAIDMHEGESLRSRDAFRKQLLP